MTHIHSRHERPQGQAAGVIYGDTVYWGTLVAAIIALAGSVKSFVTAQNVMSPTYLLASLWEGKNVDTVWREAAGGIPDGHWYIKELATGDGLTMAGIALGVFIVIPAIIAAGNVLLLQRQRMYGALGFIAAGITALAMSGALNSVFVQ